MQKEISIYFFKDINVGLLALVFWNILDSECESIQIFEQVQWTDFWKVTNVDIFCIGMNKFILNFQ